MTAMLNPFLREVHRLRKLIRDAQAEVERGPRVLKAHQTKLAAQEKAVADAKDALKHRKADVLTGESQIKSLHQALNKHEKQLDGLTGPKEIEAKQHDIANTKALIAKQEDDLLTAMTDVEERTAKIPQLEAGLVKAKADYQQYEKEAAERITRLKEEVGTATKALAAEEAKIPPAVRGQYDRLVKAHGADALAPIEGQSCSHCRVGITIQMYSDLQRGTELIFCRNCGRVLYLPA
jgi:predicted  nucleic acid-binding Zn-ribbon protein